MKLETCHGELDSPHPAVIYVGLAQVNGRWAHGQCPACAAIRATRAAAAGDASHVAGPERTEPGTGPERPAAGR